MYGYRERRANAKSNSSAIPVYIIVLNFRVEQNFVTSHSQLGYLLNDALERVAYSLPKYENMAVGGHGCTWGKHSSGLSGKFVGYN